MEECENIRKLYGYLPQVLTDREEHVIAMRYGVLGEEPHTQREVAATLGISAPMSAGSKKGIGKAAQTV